MLVLWENGSMDSLTLCHIPTPIRIPHMRVPRMAPPHRRDALERDFGAVDAEVMDIMPWGAGHHHVHRQPVSRPPSGPTCDVQVETSLFAPLRWLLAGMDRCQRAGPPPRFQHLIILYRYVFSLSFPLFSMPVSCQYHGRPSPPRPNADGAGLEPGPVCGPAARLPHDTRHRGSASPQGGARCGAPSGRNVPPAGAFACAARLDVSGAPSAPCYEDSVVNGVIDQRGVTLPVTTLWAGASRVNRRAYSTARGPAFGAKLMLW